MEVIHQTLQHISQNFTAATPKIFAGLCVCIIVWGVAVCIERMILIVAQKSPIQPDVFYLIARITKMVLVVIGIISGLGTMGIDVTAMVAGLGLTGFALGFALKDALSNVLAGVLVLIYKPFEVGARIKVAGYEGIVVRVDLRYTTLKSDSRNVLIPNANLFNHPVEIILA